MASRGRFRFRRSRRGSTGRIRRFRRRASKAMGGIRSIGHRVSGAFPAWAKPSRVAAVTGVVTGVAELVITPLPNGDSWMRRLLTGYATYQATGNPVDILAEDSDGNNAATI